MNLYMLARVIVSTLLLADGKHESEQRLMFSMQVRVHDVKAAITEAVSGLRCGTWHTIYSPRDHATNVVEVESRVGFGSGLGLGRPTEYHASKPHGRHLVARTILRK